MDREKVIYNLQVVHNYLKSFENTAKMGEWVDDALALLKEQEVKTGHWIFESLYCEAWSHKCSECGKCMTTAVNTFANWCWNCGAKMTDRR